MFEWVLRRLPRPSPGVLEDSGETIRQARRLVETRERQASETVAAERARRERAGSVDPIFAGVVRGGKTT